MLFCIFNVLIVDVLSCLLSMGIFGILSNLTLYLNPLQIFIKNSKFLTFCIFCTVFLCDPPIFEFSAVDNECGFKKFESLKYFIDV